MPSIVITGVSTGIGKACAELFARNGWQVIGTARDSLRLAEINWPGDVVVEPLDLSIGGSGAAFGARLLEQYGAPDVLLNNAGTLQFGSIEDTLATEIESIFRINVFEQIALIKALVPAMRERGSGTIANVTSLGGRMTSPSLRRTTPANTRSRVSARASGMSSNHSVFASS